MLSGRGLLALGIVVAVAVTVGIIGAAFILGLLTAPPSQTAITRAVATPAPAERMTPIPVRIDVLRANGYPMAADQQGARAIASDSNAAQAMIADGSAFFLTNGTPVQIIQIDSPLALVQVMGGQHRNRAGWLPVNATSTK